MRREDHLLKNLQGLCFGNKDFNKFHSVTGECGNVIANSLETLGPFIRGKLKRVLHKTRLKIIRRKLYHLYEHVLSKTRTARTNGSHLISVLDSFSCKCCP